MKLNHLVLTLVSAVTIVVAGCDKNGSVSVDTSKVTAAFQTAQADAKTAADSVATAIKGGDYSGAVTQLKALGSKYKLTAEQQQAVNDLMAQVEKVISDNAAKAASGATKATGDATKAATDLGNASKK